MSLSTGWYPDRNKLRVLVDPCRAETNSCGVQEVGDRLTKGTRQTCRFTMFKSVSG